MPMTKDKRDIVINTKLAATGTTASHVESSLDLEFDSEVGATLYFKDALPNDPRERSRHRIVFMDATGSALAEIAVKFVVKTNSDNGLYRVEQTLARSDFDPQPAGQQARLPDDPTVAFERTWKQPLFDVVGTQVAKHVGRVDSRFNVEDTRTYQISQTISSADDHKIVIAYALTDPRGRVVAGGSASFEIRASAAATYSLGAITIVDDPGN